jgi:hypothetical protein
MRRRDPGAQIAHLVRAAPLNLTLGLVGRARRPRWYGFYLLFGPACRLAWQPRVAAAQHKLGDHMQRSTGLRAQHYRDMTMRLRSLAELEPLASLRRHLRQLAAQHDEVAAGLEEAQSEEHATLRATLG